ncbi:MAG: helix-turn-helix transcriptional regulator [Clostridiaceae bacterium]|jgi:transcriptional regulator with XRE-family HTH domain|nr:helix-turn-helix transcriptional regulator [Clostridiaceae bacterium]
MKISIGEIIKTKREEKGFNLSEFARLIEISPGYLSQIENGRKTNPKLEIVLRIIHELDIDIEMLLGIEAMEDNYLSRIPSLIKLTLAKERNLKTLSDPNILRKINSFLDRVLEANYILENPELYNLFLEDISIQTENTLKRYIALQYLIFKESLKDEKKS